MGRLYLKSITATALLFIFVAVFPQRAEPSGLFELDLISLENSDGREVSGGCCSGLRSADNSSCLSNDCSVKLRFCITHYQSVVNVSSACTFFEFTTVVLHKDTNATYNVLPQQRVSLSMPFRWQGPFAIVVEAWHPSKGNNKNLVDRFVAQRDLKLSSEWTTDTLLTPRSSLGFRYRVLCREFYYGRGCERICRPRDDTFGHYTCSSQGEIVCMPGWSNSESDNYCRLPLCDPECQNGQCVDNNNSHECRCKSGWRGPACNICVKSEGCKHGKCETSPSQCLCDEGWGGYFCELDLNYCTNHKPCQNGGTCTNTAPGSFTCKCPDDFIGERCEVYKNPCRNQPCENGATCNNPSAGQYNCTCAPSYFGPNCDTWANICHDNLCTNGGTCIQDPNGFICSCPLGYSGMFCEKIDSTNCQVYPCRNGGTCINTSNGFHCMCPEGVAGGSCEEAIRCSADTCANGGTCIELSGNATCTCPTGYSGNHCQDDDNRCSSNPCANGATCNNLPNGYRCDCAAGHTGPNCNIPDFCASSPCLNMAICRVIANGYLCECQSGFHGDRCQFGTHASNVSHRISREEEGMDALEVLLICVLSATLVVILILAFCVARCVVGRRRKRREEPPPKGKECDFDTVEERLQNERNLMHMNNKQCDNRRIVVNELDRVVVPAKLANEAPPKVLNVDVAGKGMMEKGAHPTRAFRQKVDNTSGSLIRCHSPPCHSGGNIFVIEDHLRSPKDTGGTLLKKDILATEV